MKKRVYCQHYIESRLALTACGNQVRIRADTGSKSETEVAKADIKADGDVFTIVLQVLHRSRGILRYPVKNAATVAIDEINAAGSKGRRQDI